MTLNVIDIASYQDKLVPSKVSADAIIIKVSEGTGYTNPTWKTQANQTLAAGKKLGLYHFVREGIDGAAQADYFLAQASSFVGKAILILDFENEKNAKGVTISNVRNTVGLTVAKAFLDRVLAKTAVRALIYTNTDFEQNLNFAAIVKANYGLWIAQYSTLNAVNGFKPRAYPYKLVHWNGLVMFQYSENTIVPGYGAGIDASIFYGDKATWDKYANPSGKAIKPAVTKPAAKPATSSPQWIAESKTYTLKTAVKLRTGTSTSAGIISTLPAGSQIKTDAAIIINGYRWARQPRGNGYGFMATGPVGNTLEYVTTTTSKPAARSYTVKSGDTLSGIGAKLGVNWTTMASKNGIRSPYVIKPGQKLKY